MNDETIVRKQAKIEAARTNARAVLRLREDEGLDALIWSHKPEKTPVPRTVSEIPTSTPASRRLRRTCAQGFPVHRPDHRARHDGGHRIGRHSPDRMPPPRLLGTIH